jgi:hypothetical protein
MSSADVVLVGFAYGEHLDGLPPRSLGYRLLTPLQPEPWCAEVDALARLLQAAPYPDHWPATDLFCSALLSDGQRLVAVARYGVTDQTPGRRRGGLELFGVVGPGHLSPPSALAIYRWLQAWRTRAEDLRSLGGKHPLPEDTFPPAPAAPAGGPVPVLPVRLWQDGVLLFAATTAGEPDQRLSLLEQEAGPNWQWLPLVGPDFPLQVYARHGPLVAWTPNLMGMAVKLDRKPVERIIRPPRWQRTLVAGFAVAVLLLLVVNLWGTFALRSRLPADGRTAPAAEAPHGVQTPARGNDESREQFAQALYRLLNREAAGGEFKPDERRLLLRYRALLAQDRALRVNSKEGKAAVAALSILARRRIARIEALIREALSQKKGYDAELVDLACKRVREQLAAGIDRGSP